MVERMGRAVGVGLDRRPRANVIPAIDGERRRKERGVPAIDEGMIKSRIAPMK